uniref:Uncharacterized protein n=1 Tax=Anguilla anguilla TaxID=7936 RepID=A0A0E9PZH1_ANGAN
MLITLNMHTLTDRAHFTLIEFLSSSVNSEHQLQPPPGPVGEGLHVYSIT